MCHFLPPEKRSNHSAPLKKVLIAHSRQCSTTFTRIVQLISTFRETKPHASRNESTYPTVCPHCAAGRTRRVAPWSVVQAGLKIAGRQSSLSDCHKTAHETNITENKKTKLEAGNTLKEGTLVLPFQCVGCGGSKSKEDALLVLNL